jgi:hypothetical protein
MKKWFKDNWKIVLAWFVFGLILIVNTFHEKYPDEFDNILGGWLINRGYQLYQDFFTHHNPLAYWTAALITFFTRQSFVMFRVGLAVFWFILGFGFWKYFKKRFGEKIANTYLVYLFVYAIASTYYWVQMLLADSLSAFLYIPVFLMMITFLGKEIKIKKRDVLIIGFLTFLVWLSSQSYTYLVALTNIIVWGRYLWQEKIKIISKENFKLAIGMIAPYLIFVMILFMTGSIKAYYQQSIEFNTKYYVYNYPKEPGSMKINPVRYAWIVSDKFLTQYWVLGRTILGFGLEYPMNTALATTVIFALGWMLMKKKYMMAFYLLMVVIYGNMRGEPLTSAERDYQSAVYIFSTLMLTVYFAPRLIKSINLEKKQAVGLVFKTMFLVLLIYWAAGSFRLITKFEEKVFGKYMGLKPLIYDRPEIAPVLNQILDEDDYAWIGPFHFEEMFYIKSRLASNYTILLPEFRFDAGIQKEILADIEETKPKIISADRHYFIRGSNIDMHAQYFMEYLGENYINLAQYEREGKKIKVLGLNPNLYFTMDRDFYLRKEEADAMVTLMEEKGLVRLN